MEQFDKYEPMFKEANELIECDCNTCEKKYECADAKLSETCEKMKEAIKKANKKLSETCPEGSKERNGQCASADGNSYLKGRCPVGWIWDPALGSQGKCIKHTEK